MGERTGRRWSRGPLPSEVLAPRTWRTRADPLAHLWGQYALPRLITNPWMSAAEFLTALRVYGGIQGRHLRTLQRRVRAWKIHHGVKVHAAPKEILAIAMSASGDTAVSVAGRSLTVWHTVTGASRSVPHGHRGEVTDVAIALDGTRAVTVGTTSIRVWNLNSELTSRSFALSGNDKTRVAVSAAGSLAAIVTGDGRLRLWNLDRESEYLNFEVNPCGLTAAALSTDGARAIVGCADGTISSWDTTSGSLIWRSKVPRTGVLELAVDETAQRVAVSYRDRTTVTVWDLSHGRELLRLEGHSGDVLGLAIDAPGRVCVSLESTSLKIWDLNGPRCLRTIVVPVSTCCAISTGASIIAIGGEAGMRSMKL